MIMVRIEVSVKGALAPGPIYIIAQWARRAYKSKRTVTLAIYQPMINVFLFQCSMGAGELAKGSALQGYPGGRRPLC